MKQKIKNHLRKIFSKCVFVDEPRNLEKRDYNLAKREYLNLVEKHKKEIMSVYKVGTVGALGISDLDFIIIFKDSKKDFFGKYHIENLSSKAKYVFAHNVFYLNENLFGKLPYWFPYFDLDYIWGEKLEALKEKSEMIDLILATQYFLTKIPHDLLDKPLEKKKIFQRDLLCVISSAKHTKNLLKRMGIKKRKWDVFFKEFDMFRKNWFSEVNRRKKLIDYLIYAIDYSFEFIKEFDSLLKNKFRVIPKNNSFSIKINKRKFYFLENWTAENSLKRIIEKKESYEFPLSLGFYIFLWHKSKTFLGKRITKNLKQRIIYNLPEKLFNAFHLYSNSLEEYNNFCRKKFHYPSGEYHNLGTGYYSNNFLDWINDKIIKFTALFFILDFKARNLLKTQKFKNKKWQ